MISPRLPKRGWIGKAKRPDACLRSPRPARAVRPRIASVGHQLFDRPDTRSAAAGHHQGRIQNALAHARYQQRSLVISIRLQEDKRRRRAGPPLTLNFAAICRAKSVRIPGRQHTTAPQKSATGRVFADADFALLHSRLIFAAHESSSGQQCKMHCA